MNEWMNECKKLLSKNSCKLTFGVSGLTWSDAGKISQLNKTEIFVPVVLESSSCGLVVDRG